MDGIFDMTGKLYAQYNVLWAFFSDIDVNIFKLGTVFKF